MALSRLAAQHSVLRNNIFTSALEFIIRLVSPYKFVLNVKFSGKI
jgi:hypothetical protein